MISKSLSQVHCRSDVPGSELTTFGIGGPLKYLFEPQDLEEASQTVAELSNSGNRCHFLGAGSNLLLPDCGMSAPVIRLGRPFSVGYSYVASNEVTAQNLKDYFSKKEQAFSDTTAGAEVFVLAFGAAPLMGLSRKLCQEGLSGLEFAAGIPASLGGAVRMNAGAHGHSMEEVLEKVFTIEADGSLRAYGRGEIECSYRRVSLPSSSLVVAAVLRLSKSERDSVQKLRTVCLEYRRKTQPLHLPSAGSVFRNPSRQELLRANINNQEITAAAQLLDGAGLKGLRHGGVEYSPQHANWLVRIAPSALADDVLKLIETGADKVRSQYSVQLEPELVYWG